MEPGLNLTSWAFVAGVTIGVLSGFLWCSLTGAHESEVRR